MTEVGSENRIFSHTVSGTTEWEAEHPEMVEGMMGDMRFLYGDYTEMSLPFLNAFKGKFDQEPLIFSTQQYGGLQIMKQAIEQAGGLDRSRKH